MIEREVKWGELGFITYARTYSREKRDGTKESFSETVERELIGIEKQLKLKLSEEEKEFYRDIRHDLKGSVAGRFMWQLGTKTVDKLGLTSLQNCSFVKVDEAIRPFTWAMEMLMLGSGVGFSIKKEHVYKLPKVRNRKIKIERLDTKDADYIVPDTREGWVKLLGKVLKAHFYSGEGFSYSTQLIRGRGEPIKGFGGTASGAAILVEGMDLISEVLNNRKGKQLRPIDCLDIMNILGMIVVAGNVRRSALLAIGDYDDLEYLKAKRWDLGNIPNWRTMSNNSVDCYDAKLLPQEFWDTYLQGEPYGLVNLELSRREGRLGETQYADPDVDGYNPCAEISLSNFETCCLSEIYLPNVESKQELFDIAEILYKICKHSLAIKCHIPETEGVVHKNMRMGIGITGFQMATEEQKSWLNDCYVHLRRFDEEYSDDMGWPRSIKLTTTKPSGCSIKDTMLVTKDGLLTLGEIGDTSGKEWQDHSLIIDQEGGPSLSDKFYINGKVPTKKILTSGGIELESSLNHQYRVLRDGEYVWVSTLNLKVGDILPFKVGGYIGGEIQALKTFEQKPVTNAKIIKQPLELTPELAWLLGLYLGDGSTHDKGIRIAGDVNKKEVLDKASQIIKDTFNLDCTIYERTKGNNADLYANSVALLRWLELNELIKPKADDVEIPLIIRKSKRDVILSYIDGYASADGSTKTNGRTFCTISKKMASQLVVVLRALGIDAKSRLMPPTDSSLGDKMRYWISERKGRQANKRYINNNAISVWDDLDNLGLEDFNFDTIVKITDSENYTYDISVPENHTYIAESYVNHNTLSLLAGVTPGVHPAPAGPYYIRRIRIASDSPLVEVCKSHGYNIEFQENLDGTSDKSTYVVEFPCSLPEDVKVQDDMTVFEQLEDVKFLQKNWSDNSVSVTAYYIIEELPELRKYLEENFADNFKSLSFLLKGDASGFKQMPYETISKERYMEMMEGVVPITSTDIYIEDDLDTSEECTTGFCPIR